MFNFLMIGLGGAVGTWARYLISLSFPNGTLIVNLIGSFLICFAMNFAATSPFVSDNTRTILVSGVVGGFTTYSAFNYETIALLQSGQSLKAFSHIMIMVCGCLLAGWLGHYASVLISLFK